MALPSKVTKRYDAIRDILISNVLISNVLVRDVLRSVLWLVPSSLVVSLSVCMFRCVSLLNISKITKIGSRAMPHACSQYICLLMMCNVTMCNVMMCNVMMCSTTYNQRHHHLTVLHAISVKMFLGIYKRGYTKVGYTNVDIRKIVTANRHAMSRQLSRQYCHAVGVK